ncbi:MAG TPA: tetratricopeptide repeat protein [Alphaproteobacteria bacterium]|nr:tetratricopeptide repeat protein [Alphaproteobacteria bacterium]
MNEIFREIEEDIRRDQMSKIWKKYGSWLLTIILAIILLTVILVWWRQQQENRQYERAIIYQNAQEIIASGNPLNAEDLLLSLIKEEGGYSMLARFELAALRVKSGNLETAINIYSGISEDQGVYYPYRQLSMIKHALLLIEMPEINANGLANMNKTLENSLKAPTPLALALSINEVQVLLHLKLGQILEAKQGIIRIIDNPNAPVNMRRRLTELLKTIE